MSEPAVTPSLGLAKRKLAEAFEECHQELTTAQNEAEASTQI